MTFGVDYDVDNNNMPTSVTLQLEATDVNGASNHVPVYITINDANDNTCEFGATSVSYRVVVFFKRSGDNST